MNAELQGVEVEPAIPRDHHLAVEDAAFRELGEERADQLRKVPIQRFFVSALEQDFVTVAED